MLNIDVNCTANVLEHAGTDADYAAMMVQSIQPNKTSYLHQIRFDFVTSFPYFTEDDSGVKAVEDGQRHTDIHDDDPWPKAKEFQLQWIRVRPRLFQRIDCPHGKVAHLKGTT